MSHLKALKEAATLTDVAHLLEVKPGMLSYELYKKPKAMLYSKFSIAKRYGGVREISAPNKNLKLLQHRLAIVLENCRVEIQAIHGIVESPTCQGIAHGFKKHHSIFTNARRHVTRRNVFNVDLENFFGTINFGRVRGYFLSNKNFELKASVATILAQIASNDNQLPQGSPCSPVISNLILQGLDGALVALAKATDCTYSRYADDLTFSSNKPKFSSRIAYQPDSQVEFWRPGNGLSRLIAESGFKINPIKTRMQYRDSRQEVTGLTVNRKPNVFAPYRLKVRAMASSLFTTGQFDGKSIDAAGAKSKSETSGKIGQLIGMLAHIDWIDVSNQQVRDATGLSAQATPGRLTLFRRALYFGYFYAPSKPLIVCEGKTDNVYIKCAYGACSQAIPCSQLARYLPG